MTTTTSERDDFPGMCVTEDQRDRFFFDQAFGRAPTLNQLRQLRDDRGIAVLYDQRWQAVIERTQSAGMDTPFSLYSPIRILDKGYVRLIRTNVPPNAEYDSDETSLPAEWWNHGGLQGPTPGDLAIEEDARLSYQQGTRPFRSTRGLLRYLLSHRHTSPFEGPDMTVEIKIPMFGGEEILRHRTGSFNKISGRYSILPDEFYVPEPENIAKQSKTNRQGRDTEPHPDAEMIAWRIEEYSAAAFGQYHRLVDDSPSGTPSFANGLGVARELSRMVLPANTYTLMRMKMNLWNWLHFLDLRTDPHAQWEVRQYAHAIALLVETLCPLAYEAFEDYILNAVTLSGPELRVLKAVLRQGEWWNDGSKTQYQSRIIDEAGELMHPRIPKLHQISKRELEALVAKLSDPPTP